MVVEFPPGEMIQTLIFKEVMSFLNSRFLQKPAERTVRPKGQSVLVRKETDACSGELIWPCSLFTSLNPVELWIKKFCRTSPRGPVMPQTVRAHVYSGVHMKFGMLLLCSLMFEDYVYSSVRSYLVLFTEVEKILMFMCALYFHWEFMFNWLFTSHYDGE